MCDTCGCGEGGETIILRKPGREGAHIHLEGEHAHHHEHEHEHEHEHSHVHPQDHRGREVVIEQNILSKNDLLAERNRGYFEAKKIAAFNLVSSPGSGKTSLLERTITAMKGKKDFFVIEGDQQTMHDADRIHATGVPVIQINTGNGCHLDARMIHEAVKELDPGEDSVLMIENVGNLVCPSLFDLGESKRIVVMSVPEGDDKPIKYPTMFQSSDLCIINKTDLLPYVDFDMEKVKNYARQVKPEMEFIELSVRTGEGMEPWYEWIEKNSGVLL
ncbi:MAG: hydrogenase nickel incorporation protein HypB [Bacteroidales bacterium]|nr:hydrogenase nickel incorporation protein HypB [Bacteroidales bacterium]